jgi:hypothetical protein
MKIQVDINKNDISSVIYTLQETKSKAKALLDRSYRNKDGTVAEKSFCSECNHRKDKMHWYWDWYKWKKDQERYIKALDKVINCLFKASKKKSK